VVALGVGEVVAFGVEDVWGEEVVWGEPEGEGLGEGLAKAAMLTHKVEATNGKSRSRSQ
jgi:hypothetical protein